MQAQTPKNSSKGVRKHQKYQKFLNEIYTCIKQRDLCLKRSYTPDVLELLPKLTPKQQTLGLQTIQQGTPQGKQKKVQQTKTYKFKNFINNLDEHQRKVSVDNMNLLGLQVKKISYCEKSKKCSERQLADIVDQNMTLESYKQQKFLSNSRLRQQRKTINYYATDQFSCRKMGFSHKQIIAGRGKPSTGSLSRRKTKGSSFHIKQKPSSSKLEYKKKNYIQFQNPVYQNRINSYKQLIFKLNYVHGVYIQTQKDLVNAQFSFKSDAKYKAWIGSGNNGNLIKGLIKRRFWWNVLQDKSMKANFIWTQLRNNEYIDKQQPSAMWLPDRTKQWGRQIENVLESSQKLSCRAKSKRKSLIQTIPQQQFHDKIFTEQDKLRYHQFATRHQNKSYQQKQRLFQLPDYQNTGNRMHNHLINNFYLGNKKALFYNLKQYYDLLGKNAFTKIPLTFHIRKGFSDIQYKRFVAYHRRRAAAIKKQQKQDEKEKVKRKMRNVWIVKPGQLTNRGHGITVIDEIYQLNHIIKRQKQHENGSQKTFIVQLYLDRPLLYNKRKFDIRQFMLITHIHGLMRAYWFKEGYIRTSSYQFDIQNFQRQIHLTNDAVQKYLPGYSKYELGNKLSFAELQRYLDTNYPKKKYSLQSQVLPQMKNICIDAVKSSYLKLSPQRLQHNFQVFGLDFMIDENFKPWLIEINTNPCLEICCPLLSRLIPQMIDQSLRLSLDIVYPPPCHYPNTNKHLAPEAGLQNLNYQLIFDQKRDGPQVRALYRKANGDLLEQIGQISEDQTYQDQGKDVTCDQLL